MDLFEWPYLVMTFLHKMPFRPTRRTNNVPKKPDSTKNRVPFFTETFISCLARKRRHIRHYPVLMQQERGWARGRSGKREKKRDDGRSGRVSLGIRRRRLWSVRGSLRWRAPTRSRLKKLSFCRGVQTVIWNC